MHFLVVLVLSPLLASAGSADTLRVPQDHATIQAAVDAAQAGDTVLVSGGSYAENVAIAARSGLTLKGKGKPVLGGGGGTPLTISDSDDIAVDGFVVDGSPDSGVRIVSSSGVTVRRCTVRNVEYGIRAESSDGCLIEKNRVEGTGDDGIDFDDDEETIPVNTHCVVRKNRVTDSGDDGIEINGSGHLVERNVVEKTDEEGILVISLTSDVTVQKNRVDDAGRTGIRIEGSGHQVLRNKVADPGDEGIQVESSGSLIERNRVDRADEDAFDVEGPDNDFIRNRAKDPHDDGFDVGENDSEGATGNYFEGNKVRNARDYGFQVKDGMNEFVRNKAKGSGEFDLADETGSGTNVYQDNKFGSVEIF